MPQTVFLSCTASDLEFAHWLQRQIEAQGYLTVVESDTPEHGGAKWDKEIEGTIQTALAVMVLVSPDSATSDRVMKRCAAARQYDRLLIPVLIRHTPTLPWYLDGMDVEDLTLDVERQLKHLLQRLPTPDGDLTLGDARDAYLDRATLKSAHTVAAYERSIELFLMFLGDRTGTRRLPIQQRPYVVPDAIPLAALGPNDAPIFLHFAEWLLSPSDNTADGRPYKPTTVELRLAGVQSWFQFLDDHGWLPARFPLAKARRIVRDELRARPKRSGPLQPPDHIEEVIYYYDTQPLPPSLRKAGADDERVARWELARLRNRALLHALAETGGRISEVLSLNLHDFPDRYLNRQEVLRVEVTGKGGHSYNLRFFDSLPAIRVYIQARGANLRGSTSGDVPLFVSHDPRYDGQRMSRVVAWRVVQRAARALGLRQITPHDFRHWRATQLINAGHPLDVVQDYLGHRSVETTRAYYARTDPLRVDDAAKSTPLPDPDDFM
ncbi:MAG: tyrosine-type recombinase/integrase [Chloroflexi bacterium]|nr:tyrosine-type recombinase/integrase [Chloroflexota bacterium]